ncbi:unnamed protein product [Pedinophyceae sp. YPF-701]|nr:unnamed protein product [Pedinophyceae sp. YPF-701]
MQNIPDPTRIVDEFIMQVEDDDKAIWAGEQDTGHFEDLLEPAAIIAALYPLSETGNVVAEFVAEYDKHLIRSVREGTSTDFYRAGSILVARVYNTAVRRRRLEHLGRCHDALLALAQAARDHVDRQGAWAKQRDTLPIHLENGLGALTHRTFLAQVCFVWRCVLRLAAGAGGVVPGVTEAVYFTGGSEEVPPLDQMIADALQYFDVLNVVTSDAEAEAVRAIRSGTRDLDAFMERRRRELGGPFAWFPPGTVHLDDRLGFDYDDKDLGAKMPLPPELIPDEAMRDGARKLAEAVASQGWKRAAPRSIKVPRAVPHCLDWPDDGPNVALYQMLRGDSAEYTGPQCDPETLDEECACPSCAPGLAYGGYDDDVGYMYFDEDDDVGELVQMEHLMAGFGLGGLVPR